jgi:putative SOS response-associated peptidase YedK
MCGRFEQCWSRQEYVGALGVRTDTAEWVGGNVIPQYNVSPGRGALTIHMLKGRVRTDYLAWGYRTPKEVAENRKPWINSRIEKALTGRYFRHMFSEGRIIVPAGGWYEWTVENGKKQPWYITRKANEPIFMAGITNFRPYTEQTVERGFVILTQDCEGGMVDIHDRRPVALEPVDAWRWMDPETQVEEAAHIAQSRSLPTEAFVWWKVDRAVNKPDPEKNTKQLLSPISK